ncbi:MAG: hypothetical protein J3Q66DRAFT_344876 [Benniella sp.]|nr:MAG: hypothetical protein J3Q66DRAFT_344876 [Benniella sp.]
MMRSLRLKTTSISFLLLNHRGIPSLAKPLHSASVNARIRARLTSAITFSETSSHHLAYRSRRPSGGNQKLYAKNTKAKRSENEVSDLTRARRTEWYNHLDKKKFWDPGRASPFQRILHDRCGMYNDKEPLQTCWLGGN